MTLEYVRQNTERVCCKGIFMNENFERIALVGNGINDASKIEWIGLLNYLQQKKIKSEIKTTGSLVDLHVINSNGLKNTVRENKHKILKTMDVEVVEIGAEEELQKYDADFIAFV